MSDPAEAAPQAAPIAPGLNEASRTYFFGDVTIAGPISLSPTADGGHVVRDAEGSLYVVRDWNAIKIVPRKMPGHGGPQQ